MYKVIGVRLKDKLIISCHFKNATHVRKFNFVQY